VRPLPPVPGKLVFDGSPFRLFSDQPFSNGASSFGKPWKICPLQAPLRFFIFPGICRPPLLKPSCGYRIFPSGSFPIGVYSAQAEAETGGKGQVFWLLCTLRAPSCLKGFPVSQSPPPLVFSYVATFSSDKKEPPSELLANCLPGLPLAFPVRPQAF